MSGTTIEMTQQEDLCEQARECCSAAHHSPRRELSDSRAQTAEIGREVLPIPDVRPKTVNIYGAKDTTFPPIRPLRPPAGAPNVLVILFDDVGFGASSAFGGRWRTGPPQRLAPNALTYTRFR